MHCEPAVNLALSLYVLFPVPLDQFTSVTYPGRTGWESLTF